MNKNPMNALSIEEVFEHETFKRIRTLTEMSGNGGEPPDLVCGPGCVRRPGF